MASCLTLVGMVCAWFCVAMPGGSFGTNVPKNKDEKKAHQVGHCEGLGGSGAPEGTFYDVLGDTERRSRDDDGEAVGDILGEQPG